MIYIAVTVALTWLVWMPIHFKYKYKEKRTLSLIAKVIPTLSAAGFAGYACFAMGQHTPYAELMFAGLCVCALADWMLAVRFEVGGALFFVGHICYVLALALYNPITYWSLAVFAVSEVCLLLFLANYRREMSAKHIVLGLGVYSLALSALLGFGLPLPFIAFSRSALFAAAGAALFVASDLTLCHNTVRGKPTAWHYTSLGIYYTAQLLLALSAFPNT